jgi:hypothetical protein
MPAGAGLVVRLRSERRFLPAILVQNVVPTPRLSRVPGSTLCLALVQGRVLPVLELGPPGGVLVVCHNEGEAVALAGLEVEKSGFFPAAGDGVLVEEESVSPLDIAHELQGALHPTGASRSERKP